MGPGVGESRRAANPWLFRVEARERKPGARIGDDGLRGNPRRVPMLCGPQ